MTLRLAVDQACGESCAQFANQIAANLRPLGIDVFSVVSSNVSAAMRNPAARIDMTTLATDFPYPDPASFLTQMRGHDVLGTRDPGQAKLSPRRPCYGDARR